MLKPFVAAESFNVAEEIDTRYKCQSVLVLLVVFSMNQGETLDSSLTAILSSTAWSIRQHSAC